MKSDLRNKLWPCLILVSLFIPSLYAGEGSNGARGGGTGIQCKNRAPKVIEEFRFKRRHMFIPKERALIAQFVAEKIKDKSLYQDWLDVWTEIGSYETWKLVTAKSLKSEFSQLELTDELAKLMEDGVSAEKAKFKFENDDYAQIPKKCKKVQLSFIKDLVPYKLMLHKDLSARSKRILELHESFYILGMKKYDHFLPFKTRAIVEKIISKKEINKDASVKFISMNKRSLRVNGLYRLTDSHYPIGGRCPKLYINALENDNTGIETLIFDKTPVKSKYYFSLVKISKDRNGKKVKREVMRSPLAYNAFGYKGFNSVFSHRVSLTKEESSNLKNSVHKNKKSFEWNSIIKNMTFKKHLNNYLSEGLELFMEIDGKDHLGNSISLYCYYEQVPYSIKQLKLMNRILLNLQNNN